MSDKSHSSAYCRMGLLPMKTQASIGTPVSCVTSAMGWMSTISVRAAQLARMRSRWSEISRQSAQDGFALVRTRARQAHVSSLDTQTFP